MFKFNPVPDATPLSVLKEARRLIAGDVNGVCWTKGTHITKKSVAYPLSAEIGVCALGAITAASVGYEQEGSNYFGWVTADPEREDAKYQAERILQTAITAAGTIGSVANVNDRMDRTLDEMLAYFDLAIQIAEARENLKQIRKAEQNRQANPSEWTAPVPVSKTWTNAPGGGGF